MSRIKPVIFIFLLLPSLIWLYQFFAGSLGVNPIDQLIDKSGEFALRLLVLTLLLSSLAQLKYMRSLQMIRGMVGLFVFYYLVLHLTTYVILDHYFNWKFILKDAIKRPFITLGFTSFFLLVPLALTSTNVMVKKLTYKVWKNIHELIYVAAPLAALHFYLLTKADKIEPMIYLIIIFILFAWRIFTKVFKH